MKRTRILALMLALAATVGLAACQSGESSPDSDVSTAETTAGSNADSTPDLDDFLSFETDPPAGETTAQTTAAGNQSPGEQTPSEPAMTGTTAVAADSFAWPELDFASKTVKILTISDPTEDEDLVSTLKEQYDLTIEPIVRDWFEISTALSTNVMAGTSPDMVLFRNDQTDFYSFVVKDLVQPVEPYVDFSSDIYKDILTYYSKTKVNGKNYLLIDAVNDGPLVVYNRKIFRDSGVEEPWSYYQKGTWNWDTLKEIGPKLTADTNGDGVTDQVALATGVPYSFVYTTGQTYGKLDLENKKSVSNLRNKDIARAMNFLLDACYKDKWADGGIVNSEELFKNEMAAMMFMPDGSGINASAIRDIAARGDLGLCPMPQDPTKDKLYGQVMLTANFIPKGAANPYGAVAVNAVRRYLNTTDEGQRLSLEYMKNEWHFTDLNITQYNAASEKQTPVLELAPFLGYTPVWNCILEGTPWANTIASHETRIQEIVDGIFN